MAVAQSKERVLSRLIEDEIKESFLDYSMSVIVQRALPDVRDGLKPVHRRILYAMHELKLAADRPHKKSATVVGDVLGKFHPHGDSAVYDALVRMVQEFSLRYPLIDGQGNFGSIDGDSAAAYRYTEARLASVAEELLRDIEKETVAWADNFDGRLKEPTVLPGAVPNLLSNGSSGIAVGMSTNIPPHNLKELSKALRLLVEEPDCTVADLMRHVPGPDFPTGGFIVGEQGIQSMYEMGRGRIIMRGRVVRESLRGGKEQLVITELPYAVSKAKLIHQIADHARKGKIEDISDLRDESDRDGIRLVVELKRGANAAHTLAQLYKKTPLQSTFGAIMLALDHGQPREWNLKEMLEAFRDHRLEVIQKRTRFDLEKAEAERHITEGLLAALDHIDEVIKIIRASRHREEASERLCARFGLSEIQADAILSMRLARLTSLEHEKLEARLRELEALIEELSSILQSEARQLMEMLREVDDAEARHGNPRRTVILSEDTEEEVTLERAVADEDVVVTVSHEGFIKRMPMHLYRRRLSSGKALAGMERYEDDYLEKVFVARTQGWVLTFTEQGQVYFLSVLDIPESSRSSRGQSVYGLLGAEREDPIVSIIPADDLSAERSIIFLSEGGLMKRTALSEFSNPRSGGIIAAAVRKGDRIFEVGISEGGADVLLLTRGGRAIRFPETDISVMGRNAQGVKGMDLRGGDSVVGLLLLKREATVLSMTEDGLARRTSVAEFPLQKRGGLGTLITPTSGAASPIISALEVVAGETAVVVSSTGQTTRVPTEDIPEQGRRAKGTKVVKLARGERVVEVTLAFGEKSSEPEPEATMVEEAVTEEVEPAPEPKPDELFNRLQEAQDQLDLLGGGEE